MHDIGVASDCLIRQGDAAISGEPEEHSSDDLARRKLFIIIEILMS
jgi:hypothetical protein